jgi:cytochrome P450
MELRDVLDGSTPVSEDLPSLDYTRMIFEEALRLYPPAWVLGRVALGEDRLGGYAVPPGTIVAISPYTVHRHKNYWQDPDRFDPERFTHQRSSQRQRFSYIPFGAGPRQCIGNTFAMLEAQLIIAMVMGRFDLTMVPGQDIKPEVVFVLRPDKSMQVVPANVS